MINPIAEPSPPDSCQHIAEGDNLAFKDIPATVVTVSVMESKSPIRETAKAVPHSKAFGNNNVTGSVIKTVQTTRTDDHRDVLSGVAFSHDPVTGYQRSIPYEKRSLYQFGLNGV